jgi:hypothetical protein
VDNPYFAWISFSPGALPFAFLYHPNLYSVLFEAFSHLFSLPAFGGSSE